MKFIDDTKIPDHPYPELRKVLNTFVGEVAAELRENLVGIYLVGSLATVTLIQTAMSIFWW